MQSLDTTGNAVEVVTTGRHDPCVGIRATPICEAMVALVLMDQALRHRAQCGDVGEVTPRIPGKPPGKNDSGRLLAASRNGLGKPTLQPRRDDRFAREPNIRDRHARTISNAAGRHLTGTSHQ